VKVSVRYVFYMSNREVIFKWNEIYTARFASIPVAL